MQDTTAGFLATLHPYNTLDADALERVSALFERRAFSSGDPIFAFGQSLDGLYLVEAGEIRITDDAGRELSRLKRGNSFGEGSPGK